MESNHLKNCFICAKEVTSSPDSVAFSINNVKICQGCMEHSNPAEDFQEVKNVIATFSFRSVFDELQD